MPEENNAYYQVPNEMDEDLNFNIKKIYYILESRKELIAKVFTVVLMFFVVLTFITPKQYKVKTDLYINKSNNSNMMEINPYVLDESTGSIVSMGADKAINNEIELMKSSLVLDKVIRDNNIVYKKKFGIIPNKKEGEYLSASAFYNKGKYLKIENVKNTNVVSIEYKAKKPEVAYGIVSSLITNYIELHKELNSEKSKFDKQLIETEYAKAKESLNQKLNQATGLPAQSINGLGNLSAMSAFSNTASRAIGNIRSQYLAGEKSQIAVTEESQKVANLASKLEWAKMVEHMSDSSKVLVLNEPTLPRPFENTSPKLLINIIIGSIMGIIASLIVLLYVEYSDKKLSYSHLSDNLIIDAFNNIDQIKTELYSYNSEKVLLVSLTQLPQNFCSELIKTCNCEIIYADFSKEFIEKLSGFNKIMIISKIFNTNSESYKRITSIIKRQNKNIISDILI